MPKKFHNVPEVEPKFGNVKERLEKSEKTFSTLRVINWKYCLEVEVWGVQNNIKKSISHQKQEAMFTLGNIVNILSSCMWYFLLSRFVYKINTIT